MITAQKREAVKTGQSGCIKKPIDLVHLATQTLGDEALEAEILGLFLSQSASYLNEFIEAEDLESKRRAAHKIKGTARGLGAWDLATIAEKAEAEGFRDEKGLRAAMQRVENYIREIQT